MPGPVDQASAPYVETQAEAEDEYRADPRPVSKRTSWYKMPFDVLWKSSLVQAPRLVPDLALKVTCDPPIPFRYKMQSREKGRTISMLVTVPDDVKDGSVMPLLLSFHGGGFVLGSPLEDSPFCSMMSRTTGALVLNVDYRLGPTYTFPAAIEDMEDVLKAMLDPNTAESKALIDYIYSKKQRRISVDPTKLGVAGFSSGGNLALNAAISLPDWQSIIPADFAHPIPLLLFYPSFDARLLPSQRARPASLPVSTSFFHKFGITDTLTPTYLPRDESAQLRASPGLADAAKYLHKNAKSLLILTEIDTLAEQSQAWVKHIHDSSRADDVVVRSVNFKHGYTQMPDSWLKPDELASKREEYKAASDFAKKHWGIA